MKRTDYPTLFSALLTCPMSHYGDAFTALKNRLITDFLPPHDREGLFALALAITRLRRSHIPPAPLAAFATAVDRFLRDAPQTEQIDALLALHEEHHLTDACQILLLLLFREL
jgi:hypothetical protein